MTNAHSSNNEILIRDFFTAMAEKDFKKMNQCYSPEVIYYNPICDLLKEESVFARWEVECKSRKDLQLSFDPVVALDEDYFTCKFEMKYTFMPTGKYIRQVSTAHMKIFDGKIIEHSDAFSVHRWAMQAYGFTGWIFGWNRFYQQSIKNAFRKTLIDFFNGK